MKLKKLCCLAAALFASLWAHAASEPALTQFVNPFIGTNPNPFTKLGYAWDTGNVFPGAVCPRGMLAWSPDTTHAEKVAGGYWYPDAAIKSFSLTHFSGRGVPCLKDLPFMATILPVTLSPGTNWEQFSATYSHTNENASPGYYRVKFDNGIETELTTTPRSGLSVFNFPAHSPATVLIRADGSVTISDHEVTGFYLGKVPKSGHPYMIYFAADFDRSFQRANTWAGASILKEAVAKDKSCGAILSFDTSTNPIVQVRVGISYVSVDNARANLALENPGWNFAAVRKKAADSWNSVLNRIQVEGGTIADKHVFYSALYHCFLHPNLLDDADGRYPGMDGRIHSVQTGHHQYQNIPAWDQYRSLAPLIAILSPGESSDVMQSLVNYAQQDASVRTNGGGLPRWQQINRNSGGMVGDGDDAIIASAFAFGADNFDTKGALAAMDKGASQPGTTSDGSEVRHGLKDYLTSGHVPGEAAITLEYCNNDFALAQFAKALGDRQKYSLYQNRAQNWKNLFDDATGLIRPRNADGSWLADSKKGYIEGSAEQYVWMVNFNFQALLDKMGGNDKAVARLDHFFTKLNSGMSAATAYMGNETCEQIPWIYNFAGAPARTQKVVRRIQSELFTNRPDGLPGNDDAGALSSWYVFSALGLYPEIPGVAGFAVGSPVFTKATLRLESGAVIQIIGDHASAENCYVQKLTVNDRDWQSPWIPWSAVAAGGTINFRLGEQPSSWGQEITQAPPSFDAVQP